jgi:ABC-2 type transport system ATP-binding protein
MNDIAISTTGLSKSYGDKPALIGLDLEVPAGEVFGLLGHNGAGKTTTVIGGLDGSSNPDGVRRIIGYLPENVQFYDNLTTLENLRYFGRLSGLNKPDARIRQVLEYLDFAGHEDERVGTFSKGMRQRVGIAQAILHEPQVLFLDEPTSGLDPQGVRRLREIIVGLNRDLGMTIFMNTHLLSEVTKTCTSIGVLTAGELRYHDSLEATLRAFPGESSLEDIYLHLESPRVA